MDFASRRPCARTSRSSSAPRATQGHEFSFFKLAVPGDARFLGKVSCQLFDRHLGQAPPTLEKRQCWQARDKKVWRGPMFNRPRRKNLRSGAGGRDHGRLPPLTLGAQTGSRRSTRYKCSQLSTFSLSWLDTSSNSTT